MVLVDYEPEHNPEYEYVYNAASIDKAKVVWAHEMAGNGGLLAYFKDRRIWRLTGGR